MTHDAGRSCCSEYDRLMKRIATLEAALKPFADYAHPNRKMPDEVLITHGSSLAKRQLNHGDLYRAYDALYIR